MKAWKLLIITGFAVFLTSLEAYAVQFWVWHADSRLAPVIIVARDGETPVAAKDRYLRELAANSTLMRLFPNGVPDLKGTKFTRLSPDDHARRILLVANTGSDLESGSKRIRNFGKQFAVEQQTTYVLPVVPELGLKPKEAHEMRERIAHEFPMLFAMGGDDNSTTLYNEAIRYAAFSEINVVRDNSEAELYRVYIKMRLGFIGGVCRAMQLIAAVLGHHLTQDIPKEIPGQVGHRHKTHMIHLEQTPYNYLYDVLVQPGEAPMVETNSDHHQAVKEFPFGLKGFLRIAARASDGVVEAAEFEDGRGILLQFHPELMNNSVGQRIMSTLVKAKNYVYGLTYPAHVKTSGGGSKCRAGLGG